MISKAQRVMLFGLWRQAKNVLMNGRETWTKDEETKRRHELTAKALGREKSWSDLTNRDVDLIKAAMLAIIQSGNLDAQLDQLRQEHKRALWVVRQLMAELGKDENFVRGVIEQIDDGVDPNSPDAVWQRERERTGRRRGIDDLTADELKQVMSALRSIKQRSLAGETRKPGRVYHLH